MIGAFEQLLLTILVACMMLGMGAAMTVEGHGADSYRIALEAVASGQI